VAGKTRQKRDEALILGLARGQSHAGAAREAGVSPRTVARRMADSHFVQKVETKRQELVDEVTGGLVRAGTRAVETLVNLLDADSEAVRLGASRAILDGVLRACPAVTESPGQHQRQAETVYLDLSGLSRERLRELAELARTSGKPVRVLDQAQAPSEPRKTCAPRANPEA
jgi:hypothetical protein